MVPKWTKKRVLITVRTYPAPAQKGIEVSCTGGITDDGRWIRLFPVPYRFLTEDKRFKKYQWIEVDVIKAKDDPRSESFKLNDESIKILSEVSTTDQWRLRKDLVYPLKRQSLCRIEWERKNENGPTLGIFKPATIKRLSIDPTEPNWTAQQQNILNQQVLDFGTAPAQKLEKVPYNFRYEFLCDDSSCNGHKMISTDWEMGESYRRWRKQYGRQWEEKFRQRYELEMISKNDTHFYVGTVHRHPGTWIIVGLFYPPLPAVADLFDG